MRTMAKQVAPILNWPQGFETIGLAVMIDPVGENPDMVFQTFDFHDFMRDIEEDNSKWNNFPQVVITANGLRHIEEDIMRLTAEKPEDWEEKRKMLTMKNLEFREALDCQYAIIMQVGVSELVALVVFQDSFNNVMNRDGVASFPLAFVWPFVEDYKISPISKKIMDMITELKEQQEKEE